MFAQCSYVGALLLGAWPYANRIEESASFIGPSGVLGPSRALRAGFSGLGQV